MGPRHQVARRSARGRAGADARSCARVVCLAGWVLAALAARALGADWPQFLGPRRTGASPETGLARTWPEGGPPVLWTVRLLGPGYGGPAVHGDEVFLLDRIVGRRDVLRCLDLATGEEKWRFAYEAPGELLYPGSRSVPTVDARRVYTLGPHGHLHAVSRRTGRPRWSHDLTQLRVPRPRPPVPLESMPDFLRREWEGQRRIIPAGARNPHWGQSQSPVRYRDLVLAAAHGSRAGVVAFEKRTGTVRWTSAPVGSNRFAHVTPAVARLDGVDQLVTVGGDLALVDRVAIVCGVDLADGDVLWKLRTWKPYEVPIPSPVAIGRNRLFVAGGYGIGCFALEVSRTESGWNAAYVYRDSHHAGPHIQTPVLYRGRLYVQSFDAFHSEVSNGLTCLARDGRLLWRTGPEELFGNGPLLVADGLVFVLDGRTGVLSLVEASPREYRLLARARVLEAEGGKAWAPMALARGRLLLRDRTTLKCLDVSDPGTGGGAGAGRGGIRRAWAVRRALPRDPEVRGPQGPGRPLRKASGSPVRGRSAAVQASVDRPRRGALRPMGGAPGRRAAEKGKEGRA